MRGLLALFCKILFLMLVLTSSPALLNENDQRLYESIAESDEMSDYTQNVFDPFAATSSLVLSTKDYNSEYFVGELFSIELTAKTDESADFEFELNFEKNKFLNFLNTQTKWEKNANEYTATLYFEAKTVNAELKQIIVSLNRNKEIFQQASLTVNPLQFKRVDAGKNYSQIVAKDLTVRHFKSDFFDNKNLIMTVELSGEGVNLRNFHLNNDKIIMQRIDGLRGDLNSSVAFYSAVFDPSLTELDFSYFNTQTLSLEHTLLRVELSDDKLSTQSDLNPQSSDLDLYKRLFLWALALIGGLVFVFKKSYSFLTLSFISFVLSFFVGGGDAKVALLKANSKAQLLPTSQSTYFYTSQANEEVEVLDKRKDYIKVLLSSGKIGWVKSEALQKN